MHKDTDTEQQEKGWNWLVGSSLR